MSQGKLINVLLYGSDTFDNKTNYKNLIWALQFNKDLHRFDDYLF